MNKKVIALIISIIVIALIVIGVVVVGNTNKAKIMKNNQTQKIIFNPI